ncbi:MAG: RHS repeat-associated core domain-containing protein, partial [Candidatus Sulfotelmatobacter sp.]
MMGSAACATTVYLSRHSSTGKERDTESGNDYFGARYYASSMGRFMSPDWSAKAQPVPYAKMDNPQTLNLYAYVLNNPMTGRDPDGHVCIFGIGNTCTPAPPPLPKTPDPAHVRPVNDHTVSAAPRTPIAAPATKQGLTVGAGLGGNAEAGIGVAGAGANFSHLAVAAIDGQGNTSSGVADSGGAAAYAGDHVAGSPTQMNTSTNAPVVAGAYAGGGPTVMIANTPSVESLSGPFQA